MIMVYSQTSEERREGYEGVELLLMWCDGHRCINHDITIIGSKKFYTPKRLLLSINGECVCPRGRLQETVWV